MVYSKQYFKKGFTLIEIAVVIAIVALLAAVAVPRLTNMTANSEKATLQDFKSQLVTALSMYTAQNQGAPVSGFTDFVTDQATFTAPYNLSVHPLGTGSPHCSAPTASTITCGPGVFKKYSRVVFTYSGTGGLISATATTTAGVVENF